ncbi:hypothetical protein KR074_009163, partial [Drosophila pseudoananassae]
PNSCNNEHNLWRATKYLKRPAKRNTNILNSNGNWCRSNTEQAEAFAQHLQSVFQPNDINNSITETEVEKFLESPCQMSLPIKSIKYAEVVTEIKELNNKKAPGPDKINGITLKSLPKKCIQFITLIFNAILRLDHFPSQWKCAEIIMILKPNKVETELTSYLLQGSVLGPTLYLIYTADIPTSRNLTTSTFADDTAILSRARCPKQATAQLAINLVAVEKWLSDWRIKVNEQKCKHVTFT